MNTLDKAMADQFLSQMTRVDWREIKPMLSELGIRSKKALGRSLRYIRLYRDGCGNYNDWDAVVQTKEGKFCAINDWISISRNPDYETLDRAIDDASGRMDKVIDDLWERDQKIWSLHKSKY